MLDWLMSGTVVYFLLSVGAVLGWVARSLFGDRPDSPNRMERLR